MVDSDGAAVSVTGAAEGDVDGASVGEGVASGIVGEEVGADEGLVVGAVVGEIDGEVVGDAVGDTVGEAVGDSVGDTVGDAVGDTVGDAVGDTVGVAVGEAVGDFVGEETGEDVVGIILFCSCKYLFQYSDWSSAGSFLRTVPRMKFSAFAPGRLAARASTKLAAENFIVRTLFMPLFKSECTCGWISFRCSCHGAKSGDGKSCFQIQNVSRRLLTW